VEKKNCGGSKSGSLFEYKFRTFLKHLNFSEFEYDIREDTVYIHKELVLLQDFTTYWFDECGKYYILKDVTARLKDIVRSSYYENAKSELDKIKNNTSGQIIDFDLPIIYSAGNSRWARFIFDTIVDEDGVPDYVIGYCKDMHKEKKELLRLRNVAQTDTLTGFRNRAAGMGKVYTRLSEEKDTMHFLAVIDLDKFKSANDLFGHSFGDLVLKNVAERISKYFDHETICCRTGGDEFLFFRKCDNISDAMDFLSRLKKTIKHTISYENQKFEVNASIGFSVSPTHGTELDELYNKADAAMYYGKNRQIDAPVLYEDTMASVRK